MGHSSQIGMPDESVRGTAAHAGTLGASTQQKAVHTGASISSVARLEQAGTEHDIHDPLTCICSGGGGGLWKGSQHSGGSSSGGIRRSGANSAVLELHADVIVGPWRCVLRHGGGECEGQCRSAVRIGQSHSTGVKPRNPAFLHFNYHQHVASRRIINRVRGLGYNRMWCCLRWSISDEPNFMTYKRN